MRDGKFSSVAARGVLLLCVLSAALTACGGGGGTGLAAISSSSSSASSVGASSSASSAVSSSAAASSEASSSISSATSSSASSSVASSISSSSASSSSSSVGSLALYAGALGGAGFTDGTGAAARFDAPTDVAVDATGNVYVVERGSLTIRKITPAGVVTTLAGSPRYGGYVNGTGSAARFSQPEHIALGASNTLYVADRANYAIRKITSAGVVSTLAGGTQGFADGTGAAAQFNAPSSLTVDSDGNVFVVDSNYSIRKITPAGVVTTFAGANTSGFGGSGYIDGTGLSARFEYISGIAVGPSNNLYVVSSGKVRKITPTADVSTVASMPFECGLNQKDLAVDASSNIYVRVDGGVCILKAAGGTSTISVASGVYGGMARDAAGNIYFADEINAVIRKILPAGTNSILAGTANPAGTTDDVALSARFKMPSGIAADSLGNLFVADRGNNTLRKISAEGVVSTVAGVSWESGTSDGTGSAARFNGLRSGALDASKNMYVVDTYQHTVRKITPAGVVTTFAGLGGSSGTQDGTGNAARFMNPEALAISTSGNIFVADSYSNTIRKVTPAGVVTTFAGAAGIAGNVDGVGSNARFNYPRGIAVDSSGNVYVADHGNGAIRKITAAGVVSTVADVTAIYAIAGGSGMMLGHMTRDASNNIYVANSNLILKITPAGVLSKLVGTQGMRYFAQPGTLPGNLNNGWGSSDTSLAIVGKKLYITNENAILVATIP